jgi:general secretion pathway protein D
MQERLATVRLPRVTFDSMPLGQVLETLSALAEAQGTPVNLVRLAPGNDEPRVTMTLRDTNLERTLYYVAQSVGYRCEVEADAVVLRPASEPGATLRTEFFPVSRSALVRITGLSGLQNAAGGEQKVPSQIEVENALRAFLERAGVAFDNVPGATLALGAGQLIVTNTGTNLDKTRQILALYRQVRQVQIEARFLEVAHSDLEQFGVQWGLTTHEPRGDDTVLTVSSSNRSLSQAFGGGVTAGELLITGLDTSVGDNGTITHAISAPDISDGLDLGDGASAILDVAGVVGDFDIGVTIDALARKSGNNLLSAPKLTVLSGERAEITVARELIYPRAYGNVESSVSSRSSSSGGGSAVAVTAGTPKDFATRNVGMEMHVTAVVEDDGSISLTLEPCVTEFEGFVEYGGPSVAVAGTTTVTVPSGFYQPVFSVRRIRTEVTIDNGATVVMGGLTREEKVSVDDSVPLLGDIPFVGRLFSNKGEATQKKDLLIFVTARIVGPDGNPIPVQGSVLQEAK